MGLAASIGTPSKQNNSTQNNSSYSTTDLTPIGDTGGENGQIPPPPQP